MNAKTANQGGNEEVLRELNLFPMWQLRHQPALEIHTMPEMQLTPEEKTGFAGFDLREEGLADTGSLPVPPKPARDFTELGWAGLKDKVKSCADCDLRAGCLQTVFGSGDTRADWMIVGSWPTEDDETTGEPFSGQAGQLLDNMLAAIGLKRTSKVYLTTVVKCCGSIKRGPQSQQISQCMPYLQRQIQLVQPKLILAMGHAAATALMGEDREWDNLTGRLHSLACRNEAGIVQTIPLLVTHHPAALLLTPQNKAQAWKDLCLARDTMQDRQI